MPNEKHWFVYALFTFVFVCALLFAFKNQPEPASTGAENIVLTEADFNYGNGTKEEALSNVVMSGGIYEYKSLAITGTVKAVAGSRTAIKIYASERIVVEESGTIDVSGAGEKVSANDALNGRGGSLGGLGGNGNCLSGDVQAIDFARDTEIAFGKSGQKSTIEAVSGGGEGGGYLQLSAPEIVVNGRIIADGNTGLNLIGGGSGGKIVIITNKINGSGIISAEGGKGANGQLQGFGGGSGGIVIFSIKPDIENILVSGGQGGKAVDIYTGCNGGNGEIGKIFFGGKS